MIFEGVATDPALMQPDGIHPTVEAQPHVLDNVCPPCLRYWQTYEQLLLGALQDDDRRDIWHPYASATDAPEVFPVVAASGVRLELADGSELIDGMASWWCAIHGYNHPALNRRYRNNWGKCPTSCSAG